MRKIMRTFLFGCYEWLLGKYLLIDGSASTVRANKGSDL